MFAPAAFADFVQFVTLVIGLTAVASMALDGAVEFMFPVGAMRRWQRSISSVQPRRGEEQESSGEQ